MTNNKNNQNSLFDPKLGRNIATIIALRVSCKIFDKSHIFGGKRKPLKEVERKTWRREATMACLGSGKDRGSILGSGNVRRSFGKLENNIFYFWALEIGKEG